MFQWPVSRQRRKTYDCKQYNQESLDLQTQDSYYDTQTCSSKSENLVRESTKSRHETRHPMRWYVTYDNAMTRYDASRFSVPLFCVFPNYSPSSCLFYRATEFTWDPWCLDSSATRFGDFLLPETARSCLLFKRVLHHQQHARILNAVTYTERRSNEGRSRTAFLSGGIKERNKFKENNRNWGKRVFYAF